jgi:hypothetical protein
MEVQSAKTLLKVIGFVFAVRCLLLAYAAAARLYERLTIAWLSSSHQQMGSLALDTGGNVLLLSMCILGVVTVVAINRKELDGIISKVQAHAAIFALASVSA